MVIALSRLLAFAALLPLSVLGVGQIPVVDGVTGGVRQSKTQIVSGHKAPTSLVAGVQQAGKLRLVEKSGLCESTANVYQASGYADITSSESMWFWFFASRNKPSTDPLVIWLQGGPGGSGMAGLFQEHGPCRINTAGTATTANPYSWNNKANMIYVDQPIGVGFSHGDLKVTTSLQAAQDVWKMLQAFFADSRFAAYATNGFSIWGESYAGHFVPVTAAYILQQNAAIRAGTLTGTIINLSTIGIGDGLTDPLSQYPGYVAYAASNPYHATVSTSVITQANNSLTKSGGCLAQIQSCYSSNTARTCSAAQNYCNNNVLSACLGNWDDYDIRARTDDYPPDISPLLTSSSFMSKIGAEADWSLINEDVYDNFASSGDWMFNSAIQLTSLISAGIRTHLYTGDADFIVNFKGVEAMIGNLQTQFTSQWASTAFANYTVGGVNAGVFKSIGTLSYARIVGAGHEVPAYGNGALAVGQAAAQMFEQVMAGGALKST